MSVSREDYRYAACGLPHVVLRDLEVRRCPCGEVEVVIPRIARLHRALADVVKGQGVLTAPEAEFLRFNPRNASIDVATASCSLDFLPDGGCLRGATSTTRRGA